MIKIKNKNETTLRDSLQYKNAETNRTGTSLEEKKNGILHIVETIRNGMADIILLKTHRDLIKLLSTEEYHTEGNKLYSRRYEHGDINEKVLESLMGDIFNAEQIAVTQTDSFQCGDEFLKFLETTNEDTCL